MAHSEQTDVVVVGGGFAGLTAARNLNDRGISAIVVESRDRLGGRTWYRNFADTDQLIEMGGNWLTMNYQPLMRAELDRYEIPIELSPEMTTSEWLINGVRSSGFPVPLEEIPALEKAVLHCVRAADRIDPYAPLDGQGLHDLDVSWDEFLSPLDLPAATWDFLSMFPVFYAARDTSTISALMLLQQLALVGNSPWSFFAIGHHRFTRGTKSMIDALASDCADIRLDTHITRVTQTENGVEVTTASGETITARYAIWTTPLNCWNDVEFSPALSSGKRGAAAGAHCSNTTVKFWALVENNTVDALMAGPSTNRGLAVLSREYDVEGHALKVGFSCDPTAYDFDTVAGTDQAVEALTPGAHVIKSDWHDWNNDPLAKGSWFGAQPGMLSKSHSELSRREGRVLFASSDVAVSFMGWMEGALETAHKASTEVAALLDTESAKA
ncbi:flavin monoamine oxidase family protein (plasmid) [Nocardioides sp. R1-1]|uniref:flavin monoamine oxidase family protein n=1 Tax=Nocardioides sp. R1-1 TaxID=3383502 RepID=UPI0038D1E182